MEINLIWTLNFWRWIPNTLFKLTVKQGHWFLRWDACNPLTWQHQVPRTNAVKPTTMAKGYLDDISKTQEDHFWDISPRHLFLNKLVKCTCWSLMFAKIGETVINFVDLTMLGRAFGVCNQEHSTMACSYCGPSQQKARWLCFGCLGSLRCCCTFAKKFRLRFISHHLPIGPLEVH